MTGISQTDIEAARDAAILCLDAARHIKVFLWFDWAVISSDTQAIERFGRDASRVLASLDEHRQRLEEKTPPAVRRAVSEGNDATRQPIRVVRKPVYRSRRRSLHCQSRCGLRYPGVDTDELACWRRHDYDLKTFHRGRSSLPTSECDCRRDRHQSERLAQQTHSRNTNRRQ